jgi:hypothetical protein
MGTTYVKFKEEKCADFFDCWQQIWFLGEKIQKKVNI